MTIEEFRQNAVISALQGVIEAKYGSFLEFVPEVAAKDAIHLGEVLTREYFKKYKVK